MELVTPGFGLVFWTTIAFLLLVFLLGKYAWKPILKTVNDREQSIADALNAAEKARDEMAKLQSDHDELVKKAKAERDQILKEARETKDRVIAEAESSAKASVASMLEKANEDIKREREQAFKELRAEVASIAIEASTRILRKELSDKKAGEELVETYLSEAKLN